MNFKKLSMAAVLSIGMMTIGYIASADQTGAAAPCPPPKKVAQPCKVPAPMAQPCPAPTGFAVPCPVPQTILIPQAQCPQEVYAPIVPESPTWCPTGAAACACPIGGCLPNMNAGAKVIKRQAFAYPDIGSSGFVFPNDNRIVQIGGEEEPLAISSGYQGNGLVGVPSTGLYGNYAASNCASNCSPLALVPADAAMGAPFPFTGYTGAAAPYNNACNPCAAPVACADMFVQGLQIHRCGIKGAPGSTTVTHKWLEGPGLFGSNVMGAAAPLGYGVPMGAAAPAYMPYAPTGAAVPVNPCDPCNPCAPVVPGVPAGGAYPIVPNVPVNPIAPGIPLGSASPLDAAAAGIIPCASGACDACSAPISPATIQTSSGIQLQQTVLAPVLVPETGAAAPCPVASQFPDVSNNMISGCDINKLAAKGILAGYPDRTFKPNLPIARDEFASALVEAGQLQSVPDFPQQIFKDVTKKHWANSKIDKAYNRGLIAGYPDCTFKPDCPVTRAEALSAITKLIPGEVSPAESQALLSAYPDAGMVPSWATTSVAEAVKAGLLCNLPDNCLRPNDNASRAEIASMLSGMRIAMGLDAPEMVASSGAATQIQPQVVTTTIPTLKLKFEDIISARTSEVGDRFVAKTVEPFSINGRLYPVGSEVRGKVAEIIRPMLGKSGAIRVEFTSIVCDDGGAESSLPRDIMSAMVVREDTPNILGRALAFPFTLTGKVAGIAGRTVGGTAIVAANMTEGFLNNIGNGNNELLNLEGAAALRSYLMSGQDLVVGVWDAGRTAVSGTFGILKEGTDEVAYLVAADGNRIAQINPDEVLSVAFGCSAPAATAGVAAPVGAAAPLDAVAPIDPVAPVFGY